MTSRWQVTTTPARLRALMRRPTVVRWLGVALACSCSLAACVKDRNPAPPTDNVENDDTLCRDGVDNDGDHLFDCIDPDCAMVPACQPTGDTETGEELCGDGIDNDGKDGTDCNDPKCNGSDTKYPDAASFCVENSDELCHDFSDNDGNSYVDCNDNGCASFCDEETEAECTDGEDNGLDGKADCEDAGCAAYCPKEM